MDFYPTKAKFNRDETISFHLEETDDKNRTIQLNIYQNNEIIYQESIETSRNEFSIKSHSFEPGGYLAQIVIEKKSFYTAFDVATNMIRYGFLSDFFADESANEKSVEWLNKLHINYVQYYDWMYRHDNLIPETTEFSDLMGRELSLNTIKSRIRQTHERGMKSIAYGAIYGGTNDYAALHPDWRLYDKDRHPITFFDFLSIMNVNRTCGWHQHIINEYSKAINLGFDGIHMDTYGFPKDARDHTGRKLTLAEDFGELIDDTYDTLTKSNKDIHLIFNNVGNWPVYSVANRKQDALYIEVWDPYSEYYSIEEIIRNAKSCNSEKQVILAAYLQPFAEKSSAECYNALHLLTAIITVLGATHLIHGEEQGVITEGYYANYSVADKAAQIRKIRRYYDFITYFANLWNDQSLCDVSKTHFKGDNKEYAIEGISCSPNLEKGNLWVNIRQNKKMKFINFVNLLAAEDTLWNKEKRIVDSDTFILKVLLDEEIDGIFFSTPDLDGLGMTSLDYSIEESDSGSYAVIQMPKVHTWNNLLIKLRNEE